ncbi:MAG: DJ-1/PfpI family protein [Planctomycetes bacterium]|nr:DJ-1/PfpI family protein [Planctomycetota bacterium]MBI3847723.1 DJ-1/PfpI family protein [Planctomycetota bacterium]
MSHRRALLVLPPENFRDEEYLEPRAALEGRGLAVDVASSVRTVVRGMLGHEVRPDLLLSDVDIDRYEAVVFVGGGGARLLWESPLAHAVARRAAQRAKILGAICMATGTLARAGVLQGRRATGFPCAAETVRSGGAAYSTDAVVVDGSIVTGKEPASARLFAEALVRLLP